MRLDNKVAVITGGGSGMGLLAARNLAAAGKLVAVLDVNVDGLKETADGHDGILTIPTDVTDPGSVESAVKRCEQDLGPIDRVYNAAAIMPTGLLLEQDQILRHPGRTRQIERFHGRTFPTSRLFAGEDRTPEGRKRGGLSPPPVREANGGEGSGVGGELSFARPVKSPHPASLRYLSDWRPSPPP